jgi:hypothetical protein
MTLDVYADLFDWIADELDETVGKMWARRPLSAVKWIAIPSPRGTFFVTCRCPQSDSNRHLADFKNGRSGFRELGKRSSEGSMSAVGQHS